MTESWYSVAIETEGRGSDEASAETLDRIREAVDRGTRTGGEAQAEAAQVAMSRQREILVGPVVSWGGIGGGPGIRVSVFSGDPVHAANRVLEAFEKAIAEAEAGPRTVVRVDVMSEDYQDRWLAEEPEQFVGVAEVADILGVSKQRVSELRGGPGFPEPVTELAAGPVWRLSTLQRFVAEWPRRPGRPSKDVSDRVRSELERRAEDAERIAASLTPREREILQAFALGRSTEEVAQEFGLNPKTVRAHTRSILDKLEGAIGSLERSRGRGGVRQPSSPRRSREVGAGYGR